MTPVLLAAMGAAVLAGSILAMVHPRIALLVLVTLDVSHINTVIRDHAGVSPYVPQLALAVLALGVMARRGNFAFTWSPVLLGLMGLFGGLCLTFLDAADPLTSQSLLLEYSRNLVFFVVVYALMLSTSGVRPALQATVLVLAGLAALTIFHEYILHNAGDLGGLSQVPLTQEGGALTPRHAGTHADVNFWARLLVLFTPLSLSMLAMCRGTRARLLWASSSVALLVGVYLTQSRGGFIALFIGLVVWALLAGGVYRKALFGLPLVLAILIPLTGVGSRLATLAAIGNSGRANADPSVVERERFQIDAWRMFLDAPFTGHGIGSYGTIFPVYDRLANYYEPVTIVVAAHNFYLEQAADGGVMLLLAWAVFLGTVLFAALRARKVARATGNDHARYLAIGIVGGIVGWLAASVFLHLSDFRALLLMAAAAAALDLQVRRDLDITPVVFTGPDRVDARPRIRSLMALSAVALAALVAVLSTGSERHTTTSTLAIVPASGQVDAADAYELDVISRGLIVPTLAEALDRSVSVSDLEQRTGRTLGAADVDVDIRQSRLGGSVVVTVTADDELAAADLGAAAVALSQSEVSDLASGYQLTGEAGMTVPSSSYRLWAAVPLTVVFLLPLLIVILRRRAATARLRGEITGLARVGPRSGAEA